MSSDDELVRKTRMVAVMLRDAAALADDAADAIVRGDLALAEQLSREALAKIEAARSMP